MGKIERTAEMNLYGLIGYPLSHSFSQRYFAEKFAKEGIENSRYMNFPIERIEKLKELLEQHPDLRGFNVTIPYKEQIIPFLDELDAVAAQTGAVNTVRVVRNGNVITLKGHNTDVYGFSRSLEEWVSPLPSSALVLGTGGAAKATAHALRSLGVQPHFVSRQPRKGTCKTYAQLNAADIVAHALIVNATPLGMFPEVDECPPLPYALLTEKHHLYDLVYNPPETLFMRKGIERGASVKNGERMLRLQADKAWEIFQQID